MEIAISVRRTGHSLGEMRRRIPTLRVVNKGCARAFENLVEAEAVPAVEISKANRSESSLPEAQISRRRLAEIVFIRAFADFRPIAEKYSDSLRSIIGRSIYPAV
jgi:hypothetical protein